MKDIDSSIAFRLGVAFSLGRVYGKQRFTTAQDAGVIGKIIRWITVKGAHIPIGKNGKPVGKVGEKISRHENVQTIRKNKVLKALEQISNGLDQVTIPLLRDDLEQYGGTNDVTIYKGTKKYGLEHIKKRHGEEDIKPVLEAVANGKIVHYNPVKKTVTIQKGEYEAILSLVWKDEKKTWLLTGYKIDPSIKPRKENNPKPRR